MSIANKLTKVAENVPKVYEAGKNAEYNRFWDTLQKNGAKANYNYAFTGAIWTDAVYNPKYDIICLGALSAFRQSYITDSKVTIDVSNVNSTYMFFDCPNLKTVRKIIVTENNLFTGCFQNCTALEEIRFEGTIGKSLDLHWSTTLSAESYYSIITALSSSVSGQKFIVPPTAEATYNANPPQGDGIPQTWAKLIGTKSNWTIAES